MARLHTIQGFILTLLLVSCKCLHLTELAAQSSYSSEGNRSNIWMTASKSPSDRIIPDIDGEGPGTATHDENVLASNRKFQSKKIGSKRKAFVVLTMPRSASTTFCERLRDVEGFGCSGELLWHGRTTLTQIVQQRRKKCSIWPLDTCDQGCLTTALDMYWTKCKTRRCGFKVFPEHLQSCTSGPQYFRDIGVNKVIILERRNQTAQYESLAKAYATGDWGWGPSGKRDPEWSKDNPQQEFVRSMNQWYSTLRELYNTSLHVYVEDYLTRDPVQLKRVSYYLQSDITSPSPT